MESDTYYRGGAFPCICLLEPGTQVTLKAGTPLVQAIPILREQWSAEHGAWDEEGMVKQDAAWVQNLHMYKEQHWQKKPYA